MAKQMTADEESILKRQARRRLIGAIALTAAVVVILPIVFDGEPPANRANDIELRIPDKDKTGDLATGVAVSAVSEAPSAVMTVSAPAPASASVPAVPVVAAAVPGNTQEVKIEQPKPENVKPAQAEHKIESKPEVAVQSKVEAKTAATHFAAPHSGFVLQVGAFTNEDAAKKLHDKLVTQGLHAYTEKVGSNIRVRVGGFSSRDAADKIRHKLEGQGLQPNVINLGS